MIANYKYKRQITMKRIKSNILRLNLTSKGLIQWKADPFFYYFLIKLADMVLIMCFNVCNFSMFYKTLYMLVQLVFNT